MNGRLEELFRHGLVRCVNCNAVLDSLGGVCRHCGYANRREDVLRGAMRVAEERRLWWLYDAMEGLGRGAR